VELRVLSGDDPRTVGAVAAAVNLAPAAATANGDELAELDDTALGVAVGTAMVIGRVDPRLKARIVRALRSGGRFVAMIGDGVNDILALKEAQLGIAMGSGSSAARGVSDLILMRDDFDLLPSVVLEGRRIVVSMQATLYLLLARTGYLLLLLLVTSLLGLALPLTPRTNAALALTTVGIPIIVIALWVRPARAPRHFLRSTAAFAAPAAIAVLALSLPVYLLYQSSGVAVARTALTTITVFCGLGLISLLPGGGEAPQRGPAPGQSRLWALVAAMAALYGLILWVPLLRSVFELEPMGLADLGLMIGAAALWTAALHLIGRSRLRALPAALLRRVTRRAAR
jgi:cation-transporting ATPase E